MCLFFLHRLSEAHQELSRRKTQFERNKTSKTKEEEAEHFRWLEQQMFKIHILDTRLHRHREQSIKKFEEIDRKICLHKLLRPYLGDLVDRGDDVDDEENESASKLPSDQSPLNASKNPAAKGKGLPW